MCCFFCFKQKTAYEMRISDWSSDVCSSDLRKPRGMESRVEIERDDEVPSVDRKLLDRGDVLHSGIVDEDIHTAKAFSRFRHHRLDRVDFRQIGVAVDRARAANRLQPGAFRL